MALILSVNMVFGGFGFAEYVLELSCNHAPFYYILLSFMAMSLYTD
jgi:hypothetical protein